MWSRIFKLLRQVFNFYEDLQKLKETARQQGQQIRQLADQQTRLYYEFQIQRERDAREREHENFERAHALLERERQLQEREKELLRLENQLLRERLERLERLLPSATTDKKPDEK
jgi:peroxiredoxin